ncbi:cystatin-B-like [Monodelphis domestica]|uniref:cystatin-B-like n=1 Tax=Monodelphis domestica TaxID=13616 RepID=UPI0024E21BE7|nr:cystatin-B-like [Monodelphis domestica]
MMVGGLSPSKPANEKIQYLVDQVKSQYQEKSNEECEVFEAICYKTQMVAGIIYFVKVYIGNHQYIHLKVFQSLPYKNEPPQLLNYQTGKTEDDELTYF